MTAAVLSPGGAASTRAQPPELVWKSLIGLVAAPGRNRMRLWNRETKSFSDTTKLTERLPARPAAAYLYAKGRTQLLWLDFDAKRGGAAGVAADMATAASWITECGGVTVTDRSTSGGGHLLCPLAIGTATSLDEMVQLVRLLAARLPTLDITPNTNAETGCMTPPGSPCREGGYRQLNGSLKEAVEAFTTRSEPTLLPRLYMLLGALKSTPSQHASARASSADMQAFTQGSGENQQLAAPYVRDDPLPAAVADYATAAVISSARPTWRSHHEARQSVVVNAVARGHSHASLREMIAPGGPWAAGLGGAYDRYHHNADQALGRDVAKAFSWLIKNVAMSSPPRHKSEYTQGGILEKGPRGRKDLRDWLANGMAWADREFAGKRYRWTVHAVLQTLAFYAVVAGEQRSGTWLVGVGGRTLSVGSGLLSEDTIWRVLADLRDRPGAPLMLVRRCIGTEPDVYALTTQNRVTTDPTHAERVRVERVHDGWIVLGHHLRRIYELIVHHGLTDKADIYAAAAVPRSTGDAMVLDLEVAGLVVRTGRGTVGCGPVDLDAIAERLRLAEYRAARLERHRAERTAWRQWLDQRECDRNSGGQADGADEVETALRARQGGLDESVERAYLESVMATGPPARDDVDIDREVIELIIETLGARVIAGAT